MPFNYQTFANNVLQLYKDSDIVDSTTIRGGLCHGLSMMFTQACLADHGDEEQIKYFLIRLHYLSLKKWTFNGKKFRDLPALITEAKIILRRPDIEPTQKRYADLIFSFQPFLDSVLLYQGITSFNSNQHPSRYFALTSPVALDTSSAQPRPSIKQTFITCFVGYDVLEHWLTNNLEKAKISRSVLLIGHATHTIACSANGLIFDQNDNALTTYGSVKECTVKVIECLKSTLATQHLIIRVFSCPTNPPAKAQYTFSYPQHKYGN